MFHTLSLFLNKINSIVDVNTRGHAYMHALLFPITAPMQEGSGERLLWVELPPQQGTCSAIARCFRSTHLEPPAAGHQIEPLAQRVVRCLPKPCPIQHPTDRMN
jgi:hypothetical protein